MIFKSIRWQLQLWNGLILIGVLAGFGVTAYQFEKGNALQKIDSELQKRASVLMTGLGRPAPEDFHNHPPPEDPEGLGQPQGGPGMQGPRDYHLPVGKEGLFDSGEAGSFYYLVWRRDGQVLGKSKNAPAGIIPLTKAETVSLETPRMRGAFREVYRVTPPGELMLAGCSVAALFGELRRFAWLLAGIGGVVWLLGMAGGWWLAGRAIRPIEAISATAVKIANGDLSQRIDVSETENELGRLAGVLNSTFARLETSFAQQGQFTADAAHELRTPVSVILSQVQTTLKRDRDAADYKETLEACQRAAQKMRRLLESLLELARLDAGQEPMKQFKFNLSSTVQDCIELVQPLANEHGISIQADLPELQMTGDPDRLAQVFTNLLTNAIHYNKEKGSVTVSVKNENRSAVITVTDSGCGISSEDLPHLFKRFYRADKARSGANGQNGLGLAISKAIVEAHGGTTNVSSQLGVGSTFIVRLPV